MIIRFSDINLNERPMLILKNLDETPIQILSYASNIEGDLNYNEVSEISFSVPAHVDGIDVPGYDDITGMRIIELVGVGEFILVDPEEVSDGVKTIKNCKAYSLEYEFAKKDIYLEAGVYNLFSGINTSDENTVIGRIREIFPDWTFTVDASLAGKYRTFDDTNKKVYDFIKSDVQERYGCIFDFDTYSRNVTVKDVESKVATKQVYLSSDNLIKEVVIEEDSDSIVTCLDVYGDDGVTIRGVNPTGQNKIYNLDHFMNEKNFSPEFINRWREWEEDVNSVRALYYSITVSYNIKLLEVLCAEAELSDLDAELVSLVNLQAVTIQSVAQGLKTQAELAKVNGDILLKKYDIQNAKNKIDALRKDAEVIHQSRVDLNERLKFENYFTADELTILRRYFIEDSLEDSTFVAETAATYSTEDHTSSISDVEVIISPTSLLRLEESVGENLYAISGGSVTVASIDAEIIKATLSHREDGTFVFTAYTGRGTVGEASFENGNITLTGRIDGDITMSDPVIFKMSDGRLYFTEKCTEYKRMQIEWDLFEYASGVLAEKSTPTYNFNVDCGNFISIDEFSVFKNQLSLGERVYLDLGRGILEPYTVSVHINYDDETDFDIQFSSSYSSFDKSFALSKLLEQSVSMGKTLNHKNGVYSAFVNSGASTAVKDFMNSALDISKNAVLSSKNQAISFDDTGIHIRKWADETKTSYAPEEIWIVDNIIAFTEDSWSTAKMAIGKIFDPNLVSASNPKGTAYGIVADYLVGKIIAGENLIIQATAEDGNTVTFRVDGAGAYLYNADINVISDGTQVSISPKTGIAIGTYPVYTEDDSGVRVVDEDNAKFWVDKNGNLQIKGTLNGCDGIFSGKLEAASGTFKGELDAAGGKFSGTVQAEDYLDSLGHSMLNDSKQFTSDYLDIRGLTVRNSAGDVSFAVSKTGEVTINGDVEVSGSISWGDITDVPSEVTDAYGLANSVARDVDNLYDLTDELTLSIDETSETVKGWQYNGSTFINGEMLATDTVMASKLIGGEVNLLTEDEELAGVLHIGDATSASYAIELSAEEALRFLAGDGDLYLATRGNFIRLDERDGVYVGAITNIGSARFCPAEDNFYWLGDINHRWEDIFCVNDTINTSDVREKKDIEYDLSKYKEFYFSLKPTQYKFIDNTSNRYHVGFISQDIEDSLYEHGLDSLDFAGFIKSPISSEDGSTEYRYGLRYGEFIALNTYMIQNLYAELDALRNEIKELKDKQ